MNTPIASVQNPGSRVHVLIVEDDAPLANMVSHFLRNNGLETTLIQDGLEALRLATQHRFDAMILDIGLPGLDGIELCRRLRPEFGGPVIILTARGDEIDEVVALEVGADDYMTKPVRPRALLARLKAHLRRTELPSEPQNAAPIRLGELVIDPATRTVKLADRTITLTTAEFDLLHLLALNAGQVIPRAELYEQLNGIPFEGMDRSIDLRVSRLRKKLGDDPHAPQWIKSVRGVGYILAIRS